MSDNRRGIFHYPARKNDPVISDTLATDRTADPRSAPCESVMHTVRVPHG